MDAGATQKLPKDFEQQILEMNYRMAHLVNTEDVPAGLIYSMDETSVAFIPAGNSCTFEVRGTKHVEVAGGDEKRNITVSMTSKPDGRLSVPLHSITHHKPLSEQQLCLGIWLPCNHACAE